MDSDRIGWNVRHLFFLVPWLALGVVALRPIRDNSFLWHIQAGILQGDQGQVLTADPFSFSFQGEPWRTQSWLVELGYSWLFRHFDLWFVIGWILVLGGVLMAAIGITAFRRSGALLPTAGVLVGMSWLGMAFVAPRPVIVSFVALSVLVVAMESRKTRWTVLLIIWVWSAAHGSFVLGIGYLILCALRARERRSVLDIAFAVAVSSLTAHGYHVWGVLWEFLQNRDALGVIQEWSPPQLTHLVLWPYAVAVALIMVQLASREIDKRDLWVIIPFLLFGLTSQRALFLAAIVLGPWVLPRRQRYHHGPMEGSTIHPGLLVLIGTVIAVLPPFLSPAIGGLDESVFPIEAADHLTSSRVFHDEVVGGYLMFEADGRRVLVDDRAELYGREFFDAVFGAEMGQPEWRDLFAAQNLSQALLRTDDRLATVLEEEGWRTDFEDPSFIVLTELEEISR